MSTRLLILTAGFGEGHNAAARALAVAAEERHGAGSAKVADVFALARPRWNALARRSYLSLINRAPGLWQKTYAWLDRSPRAPRIFAALRAERRTLARLIAAERPQVVCSTYPVYAYLLPRSMRDGSGRGPVHCNVVTDSISINALWWRQPCAAWFVPNEDTAAVLRERGLPPERVRTLGFPVAPCFADEQGRLAPPALGRGERPRVLYVINSGTAGAAEAAVHLLAQDDWDVTCTVGRNEALRMQLSNVAARRLRPAAVLGWTNEMPRLLMTHHVVISKAGGATTQEAIAARCPMIVSQIVPGQEEGNYELLRRHGIGALAETPDAIVAAVREAFADDAARWHAWRAALDGLARPDAARDIVAALDGFTPMPLSSPPPAVRANP